MKHDRNHRVLQSAEAIGALISRYRGSGLALKDFAREEGLPPGRLHYWLYQKHRVSSTRGSPKRLALGRPAVFQEVNWAGGAPWGASWAAEVSLPGGVAVRFVATAEPSWLAAVVQALQRSC
jgi:hypothetical protein